MEFQCCSTALPCVLLHRIFCFGTKNIAQIPPSEAHEYWGAETVMYGLESIFKSIKIDLKHNNNNCKSVCDIDLAFCCTILVWVVKQAFVLLLKQSKDKKEEEKPEADTEASQKVE